MSSKAKTGGALSGAASGASAGAAFGPWGAVIGGVIGGAAGLFSAQDAPTIKDPPKTNYQAAFNETEQSNARNLAGATRMAAGVNTASQNEANRVMEMAIPGFSKIRDKLTAAAMSDLESENGLPAEMEQELARLAAERGISRGTSGQFNDFSLMKDFGFNMVDYAQAQRVKALNTLSQITGMSPRINPMSPMSSLLTVDKALGIQDQNNQRQWQTDMARAGVNMAAANYNSAMISGNITSAGEMLASWQQSRTPAVQDPVVKQAATYQKPDLTLNRPK
jgi:hypothetical protein